MSEMERELCPAAGDKILSKTRSISGQLVSAQLQLNFRPHKKLGDLRSYVARVFSLLGGVKGVYLISHILSYLRHQVSASATML